MPLLSQLLQDYKISKTSVVFSVVPKKNEHPKSIQKSWIFPSIQPETFHFSNKNQTNKTQKVWLFPGASASLLLASALVSGGKIPKVGFILPRLSHHFSLEKRGKFVHPLRARPLRALFVTPPPPLPRNARRPGRPRKFDFWGKVGKFWGKNR